MTTLRIIGDVHGQVDRESLFARTGQPYAESIRDAEFSVQIGDFGDAESYAYLREHVDPCRHRFVPGNHDHYDVLPPHSLGDFGLTTLGGVEFFFIRGAASLDRNKLVQLGRELGKTLWFAEEELTDEEMAAAEHAYRQARPSIVLSHDGPTEMARFAAQQARCAATYPSVTPFTASRTNRFLDALLALHAPRLWVFGHHHRDWSYSDDMTQFICVGELSWVDIEGHGNIVQ